MSDDIINNSSPLPEEETTEIKEGMDFFTAFKLLAAGKIIRRFSWPEQDHGLLSDGFVKINKDGVLHNWIISDGDISGIDWITVD